MEYYSAREAARRLGVSRATIYAYVSRGWIRSEAGEGRERRYVVSDVEALVRKKRHRRDPSQATREALDWGLPVLESSITEVGGGVLRYRGRDVVGLSREVSFEAVVGWLWRGSLQRVAAVTEAPEWVREVGAGLPLLKRCQVALLHAEERDLGAYQWGAEGGSELGERVIRVLFGASGFVSVSGSLSASLAEAVAPGDEVARGVVEQALVLCADHELNASTFAARCAASAGATVYSAVAAALVSMRGRRHGGAIPRIGAFLEEVEGPGAAAEVMVDRLRRGDGVPGFGHPLYPEGDVRAAALLERVFEHYGARPAMQEVRAVWEAAPEILEDGHPTIDWALMALARALGASATWALYVFAMARSAGWIAHIIEQYAAGDLLRPRARYVGA